MSDPFTLVFKLQISLFRQWCGLASDVLQLFAPEPPPIPVKVVVKQPGTGLVLPHRLENRQTH